MVDIKHFIFFSVAVYAVCAVDETNKRKAVQEENEANEAFNDESIEHHVIIRTPGIDDLNIFKHSNEFVAVNGTKIPRVDGSCDVVVHFSNGENITVKFEGKGRTIVSCLSNKDNLDSDASTSSVVNLALEEVTIVFNGQTIPGNIIGNKDIIIDRNVHRLLINGKIVPGVTGQDVMVIDYSSRGGITINGKKTEGFEDIKGVGSTILLDPKTTNRVILRHYDDILQQKIGK